MPDLPSATHRSEDEGKPQATVAYELTNPGNARLLDQVLSGRHAICRGLRAPDMDIHGADILIVDPGGLERMRSLVRELRSQALPAILPVLLIATAGQAPEAWIRRELGRTVDDVLRIPTTASELTARIDNLLRLRDMSRLQEQTVQELRRVVRAMRTLNHCDEILVRTRNEEDLLKSICQAIVDTEDYRLAWVGCAGDQPDQPVRVRACAGPASSYLKNMQSQGREDVVGAVLCNQQTQVVTDIASNPGIAVDQERARDYGLASVIMLPLPVEAGPPGCMAIYSNWPGHFDRESQQLLERLARNLTFGLNALHVARESQRQASKIRSMAYTDALTGLPNRQHCLERLNQRLSRSAKDQDVGAVFFIDLDLFKMINDALGHHAGDQVLREVGARLRDLVRGEDLVARHGGDEFLVAMFDAPREDATGSADASPPPAFETRVHQMAERILQQLCEPIILDGHEHRLGASIGISLFPMHGLEARRLVEKADTAMYEAKKHPDRHICFFANEILERRQQRLSLEDRLYQAINRNELVLHYQPVFRLDTQQMIAVEALVRWPQEDDTFLPPSEFLPVAEETGMIIQLGEWVLATAARQLREWHDLGYKIGMMINLSVRQLHGGSEMGRFAQAVRPYIDPSWIELEITEQSLMVDPPVIEANLQSLYEQGFRLAIDDFGTGYSSLSRIKDLPFHTLKIDLAFVAEIGQPGKGHTVIQTILQLAGNLSLRAIAEGIETEDQYRTLLEWGCGYGQGFWFSTPLSALDLADLLKSASVASR